VAIDQRRQNDVVVSCLRSAVTEGASGLGDVPTFLKDVIRGEMWRERVIQQTGEIATFERFIDFVHTKPLEGLGADLKTLQRLCADDPEAADLLDQAVQGKPTGRPPKDEDKTFDNVQDLSEAPTGNTRAAGLRRLRKDRPDLHERVVAGELKVNAAMVEAGFRPKTITVPLDTEAVAAAILRHFTPEQIAELVTRLLSLKT